MNNDELLRGLGYAGGGKIDKKQLDALLGSSGVFANGDGKTPTSLAGFGDIRGADSFIKWHPAGDYTRAPELREGEAGFSGEADPLAEYYSRVGLSQDRQYDTGEAGQTLVPGATLDDVYTKDKADTGFSGDKGWYELQSQYGDAPDANMQYRNVRLQEDAEGNLVPVGEQVFTRESDGSNTVRGILSLLGVAAAGGALGSVISGAGTAGGAASGAGTGAWTSAAADSQLANVALGDSAFAGYGTAAGAGGAAPWTSAAADSQLANVAINEAGGNALAGYAADPTLAEYLKTAYKYGNTADKVSKGDYKGAILSVAGDYIPNAEITGNAVVDKALMAGVKSGGSMSAVVSSLVGQVPGMEYVSMVPGAKAAVVGAITSALQGGASEQEAIAAGTKAAAQQGAGGGGSVTPAVVLQEDTNPWRDLYDVGGESIFQTPQAVKSKATRS